MVSCTVQTGCCTVQLTEQPVLRESRDSPQCVSGVAGALFCLLPSTTGLHLIPDMEVSPLSLQKKSNGIVCVVIVFRSVSVSTVLGGDFNQNKNS